MMASIRRLLAKLRSLARGVPTSPTEMHQRTLLRYDRAEAIRAFTLWSSGWSVDDIGQCFNKPIHVVLDLVATGQALAEGVTQ